MNYIYLWNQLKSFLYYKKLVCINKKNIIKKLWIKIKVIIFSKKITQNLL